MGKNSGIAWTDHTWNPWMGCSKVSPGCKNCYAEDFVSRRMRLPVWGPPSTTERKRTSSKNWKLPHAWNREAIDAGRRQRVFCSSLADIFEDHPMVSPWREEAFGVMESTASLDWLLLTKRPENILRMIPSSWLDECPENIWFGTTVEDRDTKRIKELLRVPGVVRFLSMEPLLEEVHLDPETLGADKINWIIVGGESGNNARPFNLDWAKRILDESSVPVFIKQLGAKPVVGSDSRPLLLKDSHGADPGEWPQTMLCRQFPL